ncbi:hypothetical protein [Chelativorans intermedius]|uniref:Uncharacterized protein n=1 Tax=Chelativorans intermedius TaxID=515947 RepID=A0ABV6DD52_9HYPH|nr:hypothetical protein [Chelativorans intermedius]MCT8999612.1 hypothetical protein [Chelativorans intermedius]
MAFLAPWFLWPGTLLPGFLLASMAQTRKGAVEKLSKIGTEGLDRPLPVIAGHPAPAAGVPGREPSTIQKAEAIARIGPPPACAAAARRTATLARLC